MTRGQKVLWWLLLAFGVLLAVGAGVALWAYQRLEGNIRTDHAAAEALERDAGDRPRATAGAGRTIMVIGDDLGSGTGNARSDTVLLLHLSAGGDRADVVSVPRDIVADIPACHGPDGEPTRARRAQFNWAYQFGGAACTIRTFEGFADLRIDHHLVIGFDGFARLVDAVGGVEVELAEAERDPNVGHDLSAGRHLLDGEQALAYVRARVHVGDGSDLNRLERQQRFLGLLRDRITESGVLTDPARLYPVLTAVTSAITADPGLDSLDELRALAADLRGVPEGGVTFHTVPTLPHPTRPDRLVLDRPAADRLFDALRDDRPLTRPAAP
ncbi:LCP family protein [Streptomyces sp. RFCAC02]|uniref:LCP family protein n=1 Tax=Streptomyces sp. RFCAC02 TaxID=2499143 RepID=UPI00143DC231|nr:LCP family protein [Streptomyces sp. RFCAC02]